MNKYFRSRLTLVGLFGLLFFVLAVSFHTGSASPEAQKIVFEDLPTMVVRAGYVPGGSPVKNLAPQMLMQKDAYQQGVPPAVIHVTYIGEWDPNAKAAFEYAKRIWETQISSPVPIEIRAEWVAESNPNILGGAWPEGVVKNFPGAPVKDTWYLYPLANKLAGVDLDSSSHDINAQFNSNFSKWYFGTDGKTPSNSYDFVSVVLHEIAHGLGFYHTFQMAGSSGSWGFQSYPIAYDRFLANGAGQVLIKDFLNNSTALGAQLTSNDIFFTGAAAIKANGSPPELYAPSSWSQGSSLAHVGEGFNNTPDALMTYSLSNGEVQQNPGPLALGILEDLGWDVASPAPAIKYTHKNYLPWVTKQFKPKPAGIAGRITLNGVSAADVTVNLCNFSAGACASVYTTTTDLQGNYVFVNTSSLAAGHAYYAYFSNRDDTPGRLWYWQTSKLDTYKVGTRADLPAFDISDIALVAPAAGATANLPVTFEWNARAAAPKDSYEFNLYGSNYEPLFWTDPSLGHVSTYTIETLPESKVGGEFTFNTPYRWEIWAYGDQGGYGISLEARQFVFTSAASGSSPPASQPPPSGAPAQAPDGGRLNYKP
jgi:hypothetical protein